MQKRKDIRNFYVDEEFAPIYEKFKVIIEREGESVSSKLRGMVSDYVRLHEPGNPQQRLDVISELGKAYRADQCFYCKRKPEYKVFEDGKTLLVCREHFGLRRVRFTGWNKL